MSPLTPYEQWQLDRFGSFIPEVEQEERSRGEDLARWIEREGELQLLSYEED